MKDIIQSILIFTGMVFFLSLLLLAALPLFLIAISLNILEELGLIPRN